MSDGGTSLPQLDQFPHEGGRPPNFKCDKCGKPMERWIEPCRLSPFTKAEQAWLDAEDERFHMPSGWMLP